MERITIIPDEEFLKLSQQVKVLRNSFYSNDELKIDFVNLIFTRIDELLEKYSIALKEEAEQEVFTKIKNALEENCYILNTAISINDIIQIKQIAYKKRNKHELLIDDSTTNPIPFMNKIYSQLYSKKYTPNDC